MSKEKGFCLWLFGLSGAGKTTLGDKLYVKLDGLDLDMDMFDGDTVRRILTPDLGFSLDDRFTHIRRVAFVVRALIMHGVNVVCSFITPLKAMRYFLQQYIPNLLLIECKASIQCCMGRDPKGMYAKALNGEIKDFTGLTQLYEPGEGEEWLSVDTWHLEADQSFKYIMDCLRESAVIE
jgi:adenylylsulfate kinase